MWERGLGKPGERTDFAGYDDASGWAADFGLLNGSGLKDSCRRRDAVAFLYRALA